MHGAAVARWHAAVAGEWAAVVACLVACSRWPWLLPLAIVVIGTRQHALAVLAHDAAHGHGGRLGVALCGPLGLWPLGVGLVGYRAFHWQHHRGVGAAGDPELPLRRRQEAHIARRGLWRAAACDLVGAAVVDAVLLLRAIPPRAPLDVTGPLALHALFVVLAPWPVLVGWYVAHATAFMAVFRLRAATEHVGRVTRAMPRPALWRRLIYLPHHTWRHFEHHRLPGVPTWRF